MKASTLVDVLCAAHLSGYVEGPYPSKGGIMLTAGPEMLKTSFLKVLEEYPSAAMLSDLNTQQLIKMRDQIAGGLIRSMVFLDFQKVYERQGPVSLNVEGHLRSLASEGFTNASFENSRMNRMIARSVIIAALTPALKTDNFERWEKTGFARRFLFVLYRLRSPEDLTAAIKRWEKKSLGLRSIPTPANASIPFLLTPEETAKAEVYIRYQYGRTEPLQNLCKIWSVLKWHYDVRLKKKGKAAELIADFSESLSHEGADVTFED